MSVTECRAVGVVERGVNVNDLANMLRSLCSNYTTHTVHEVTLRMPLASGVAGGGAHTTLRLSRRLPHSVMSHGSSAPRPHHPLMDDPPERWEVRHEGPLLQGPALNALPAAMREVTDAACFGAGAVEFWKGLGGKFEYETYREGNEYHIVFQGHEIKVILATLHSLVEQHVLRDASSVRPVSGALLLDVSCLVPEGQHAAGAHVVGAFGVLLSHYGVRLVRAEVPQGAAARRK